MDEKDKNSVENICRVFQMLPENKREYLMGIADGMAAMTAFVTAQPPYPAEQS